MTRVPLLPDTAPFNERQRAWLNGYFAAILSGGQTAPFAAESSVTANGPAAASAAPSVEEEFPWHDSSLPLDERLNLSEGRALPRRLMSAMAQLNCGACGYLCQTYAEAIAGGGEGDLTKCTPGGAPTAKALKHILTTTKIEPPAATTLVAEPSNGSAQGAINGAAYSRANPFTARLVSSERLTHIESPKDTRHIVIDLLDSGLTYEAGDSLGILPRNEADLVQVILTRLGRTGGETVRSQAGGPTSLRHVLTHEVSLTRVRPDLVALLREGAPDPDADALLGGDVLDVLEHFPRAQPTLEDFLAALGKLQPRLYSISSSLKAHPREVHLTVGVVRFESFGKMRNGLASHFLGIRAQPGDAVRVFVQPSKFRLPSDANTPVIMIGPGTGIAPFRAFLEERRATGANGKAWLFFGNQYFQYDFLYKKELEEHLDAGSLTRLDLAFSRDQAEKAYVQHRMLENGRELWRWIEEGAHLFVCGDAKRMAVDVEQALRTIVAQYGGQTESSAKEFIATLKKNHRYHKDVY